MDGDVFMGVLTMEATAKRWTLPQRSEAPRAAFGELAGKTLPGEVEFILSALEAARQGPSERRSGDGRVVYRTLAELELFADASGAKPWVLYTRDVMARGMGFVTRHRLPLGYGGIVHVRGPKGETLSIDCTLRRCRETVNGWFEGALSFNREQWALGEDNFLEGRGAD